MIAAPRMGRRMAGIFAFHMVAIALSALFLAPIAWTVLSSFKPPAEALLPPLPPWPTGEISFGNYAKFGEYGAGVWRYAFNSLSVALMSTIITVVISLLAGFGFSRFPMPYKNVVFLLVLAGMMVPFQSIMTPLFIILSKVGLTNSLFGLSLIYVTLQLPFSIFVMRNAFDAIPRDIDEAARIDGTSPLRLLGSILIPLALPGIATVAMFAFLGAWNEFLAALIFLNDQDLYTLPILTKAVTTGQYGSIDWGAVQAGVTILMVPCLVVFLSLQKAYLKGITAGSVK